MLEQRTEVLVEEETRYQKVEIKIILPKYGKCLFLDGDLQSAQCDQDLYHSALVNPAFRYNPDIQTALILGGGEGATAKKVLCSERVKRVRMVDIDRQLVEICRKELPEWGGGAFEDPRLVIDYQDAAKAVLEDINSYDFIVWDLTDPYIWEDKSATPATNLYTPEFFNILKYRLTENGLLSVEYAYRNRGLMSPLLDGWHRVCRRDIYIPSFEEKWIFALMSKTNRRIWATNLLKSKGL